MTKENLEQRKTELEQNLEQAKATLYRIDGALQLVNSLLAEFVQPIDAV